MYYDRLHHSLRNWSGYFLFSSLYAERSVTKIGAELLSEKKLDWNDGILEIGKG